MFEADISFNMYTRTAGTIAFAAPERLAEGKCRYTEKVDLWSAGIVLIMLLTGVHPFATSEVAMSANLFNHIMNGEKITR